VGSLFHLNLKCAEFCKPCFIASSRMTKCQLH
jgi:hypothetical protein